MLPPAENADPAPVMISAETSSAWFYPAGHSDDVVDQPGAGEGIAHVVAIQGQRGDALVQLQLRVRELR